MRFHISHIFRNNKNIAIISEFTVIINILGELEIELERRQKIELRSTELQKAFDKPKATEYQLKQIERGIQTITL